MVKEFQLLLFNTHNSIQHYSFIYTKLNDPNYCYLSLTIQFNIRGAYDNFPDFFRMDI